MPVFARLSECRGRATVTHEPCCTMAVWGSNNEPYPIRGISCAIPTDGHKTFKAPPSFTKRSSKPAWLLRCPSKLHIRQGKRLPTVACDFKGVGNSAQRRWDTKEDGFGGQGGKERPTEFSCKFVSPSSRPTAIVAEIRPDGSTSLNQHISAT